MSSDDNIERMDAPNKQAVGLPPPWEEGEGVQPKREGTVTQTTPTDPAQPAPEPPTPEPVPDDDTDDDTDAGDS